MNVQMQYNFYTKYEIFINTLDVIPVSYFQRNIRQYINCYSNITETLTNEVNNFIKSIYLNKEIDDFLQGVVKFIRRPPAWIKELINKSRSNSNRKSSAMIYKNNY